MFSLKLLVSFVLALASQQSKSSIEAVDISKLVTLGSTSVIQQVDPCDKHRFIHEHLNNNKALTNSTLNELKKNCSKLAKDKSFQCKAAEFTLYYAERSNMFYYYIDIIDLNAQVRKDCWGFMLRVWHNDTNEIKYINFHHNVSEVAYLYDAVPNKMFTIDLITLPIGPFPVGGRADVNLKSPTHCENAVLKTLNNRLFEVQANCSAASNHDLNTRIHWASKICNKYPTNPTMRTNTANMGISSNCTISFDKLLPQTNRGNKVVVP